MNPRPLHRSLIFWSGILVMIFIAWAWRDSSTMGSGIHVRRHTVINSGGFVGLIAGESNTRFSKTTFRSELDPTYRTTNFPLTRVAFVRGQGIPIDQPLPESLSPRTEQDKLLRSMLRLRKEAWVLFIPHQLLLLAVALLWSGLLIWRERRMRRAMVE